KFPEWNEFRNSTINTPVIPCLHHGNLPISRQSRRQTIDSESAFRFSLIRLSGNPEPLHLGLQSGPLQPQPFSGPVWSRKYSARLSQYANNVQLLGINQRLIVGDCGLTLCDSQFFQRDAEDRAFA